MPLNAQSEDYCDYRAKNYSEMHFCDLLESNAMIILILLYKYECLWLESS